MRAERTKKPPDSHEGGGAGKINNIKRRFISTSFFFLSRGIKIKPVYDRICDDKPKDPGRFYF